MAFPMTTPQVPVYGMVSLKNEAFHVCPVTAIVTCYMQTTFIVVEVLDLFSG